MLNNFLLVAAGGATGACLRYLIALLLPVRNGFPLSTLSVNIIGCFLIGLIAARTDPDSTTRLLLGIGFCGGFTTFSAFSIETISLIKSNQLVTAVLYILISVIGGLAATFAGYKIMS